MIYRNFPGRFGIDRNPDRRFGSEPCCCSSGRGPVSIVVPPPTRTFHMAWETSTIRICKILSGIWKKSLNFKTIVNWGVSKVIIVECQTTQNQHLFVFDSFIVFVCSFGIDTEKLVRKVSFGEKNRHHFTNRKFYVFITVLRYDNVSRMSFPIIQPFRRLFFKDNSTSLERVWICPWKSPQIY